MDVSAFAPEAAVKRMQGIIVMLQSDKQELAARVAQLEAQASTSKGANTRIHKTADSYRQLAEQLQKDKDLLLEELNVGALALKKKAGTRAAMSAEEAKVLRSKLAEKSAEVAAANDAAMSASEMASQAKASVEVARKEVAAMRDRLVRAEDFAEHAAHERDLARDETSSVRQTMAGEVATLKTELAGAHSSNMQAGTLLAQFMGELERARDSLRVQEQSARQAMGAALLRAALLSSARLTQGVVMARWRSAVVRATIAEAGVEGEATVRHLADRLRQCGRALRDAEARCHAQAQEVGSLGTQLAQARSEVEETGVASRAIQADAAVARELAAQEAARGASAMKQLKVLRGMLVAATQAQAAALKKATTSRDRERNGAVSSSPTSSTISMDSVPALSGLYARGRAGGGVLESPTSPNSATGTRRHRENVALSEPVDDDDTGSMGTGVGSGGRQLAFGAFGSAGGAGGPSLAAARAAIDNGECVADAVDVESDGTRDPWFDSIRLLAHVHAEQTRARVLASELSASREDIDRLESTCTSLRAALEVCRGAERSAAVMFADEELRRLALQAVVKRLRLLYRGDVDAAAQLVAATGIAPLVRAGNKGTSGGAVSSTAPGRSRSGSTLSLFEGAMMAGHHGDAGLVADGKESEDERRSAETRRIAASFGGMARDLLYELADGPGSSATGASVRTAKGADIDQSTGPGPHVNDLTLDALADSGLGFGRGSGSELSAAPSSFSVQATQNRHATFLSMRCSAMEMQLAESDAREGSLRNDRAKLCRDVESARIHSAHVVAQLATVREQAAGEASRLMGEVARAKAGAEAGKATSDVLRSIIIDLESKRAGVALAESALASANAAVSRLQAEVSSAREAATVEASARERVFVQLEAARASLAAARGREMDHAQDASTREVQLARDLCASRDKLAMLERQYEASTEEAGAANKAAAAAQHEAALCRSTRDEAATQLARALDRLEQAYEEQEAWERKREEEKGVARREAGQLAAALQSAEERVSILLASAQSDAAISQAAALTQCREEMGRRLATCDAEREQAAARAATAEAELSETRSRLEELRRAESSARAAAEAAVTTHDDAQYRMHEARAEAAALVERVAGMAQEKQELAAQLSQAVRDTSAARAAASIATAVATTPRRTGAYYADIHTTDSASLASAAALEVEVIALRSQLSEKNAETEHLKSTTERAMSLLSGLKDTLVKRDAILSMLEQRLADANAQLAIASKVGNGVPALGSGGTLTSDSASQSLVVSLRDTIAALRADLEGAKEAVLQAAGQAALQAERMANLATLVDGLRNEGEATSRQAGERGVLSMARHQRLMALGACLAGPFIQAVETESARSWAGAPTSALVLLPTSPAHVSLPWSTLHEVVSMLAGDAQSDAGEAGPAGQMPDAADLEYKLCALRDSTASSAGLESSDSDGGMLGGAYTPHAHAGLAELRALLVQALGRAEVADEGARRLSSHAHTLSSSLAMTQAECLRLCEELCDKTGQVNDLHARLRMLEEVLAERDAALAHKDAVLTARPSITLARLPVLTSLNDVSAQHSGPYNDNVGTPGTPTQAPSTGRDATGQGEREAFTPVEPVVDSPSAPWKPVGLLLPQAHPLSFPLDTDARQTGAPATEPASAVTAHAELEVALRKMEQDLGLGPLAQAVRRALESGDASTAAMAVALAQQAVNDSASSSSATAAAERNARASSLLAHEGGASGHWGLSTIAEDGNEGASQSDGASLQSSPATSQIAGQGTPSGTFPSSPAVHSHMYMSPVGEGHAMSAAARPESTATRNKGPLSPLVRLDQVIAAAQSALSKSGSGGFGMPMTTNVLSSSPTSLPPTPMPTHGQASIYYSGTGGSGEADREGGLTLQAVDRESDAGAGSLLPHPPPQSGLRSPPRGGQGGRRVTFSDHATLDDVLGALG